MTTPELDTLNVLKLRDLMPKLRRAAGATGGSTRTMNREQLLAEIAELRPQIPDDQWASLLAPPAEEAVPAGDVPITHLPLALIDPHPDNPRKRFDPDEIAELATSMRNLGVLQALLVRPRGERFQIVCGARRYLAATEAGLESVPVVVRDLTDAEAAQAMLLENLQRQDLTPIETARALKALNDAGMSQTEIGKRLGVRQTTVSARIGLLRLPESVIDLVDTGRLSHSHAEALLRFAAFPEVVTFYAVMAVQTGVRVTDLERQKVPWAHELTQQNLARELRGYTQTLFDKAVCEECPYGAHVGEYCLNPAHYDELTQEAREAMAERNRKEREALLARATTEGNTGVKERLEKAVGEGGEGGARKEQWDPEPAPAGTVDLRKLPANEYVDLRFYPAPKGCSKQCPCYAVGIAYGERQNPVCLDPQRYRSLKLKQGAAERKTRKEHLSGVLARLERGPNGAEERAEWVTRGLALLALQALHGVKLDARKAAGKGVDDAEFADLLRVPAYGINPSGGNVPHWSTLARVPAQTLILAVAEALVREELAGCLEYKRDETPLADFALGVTPLAAKAGAQPDPEPLECSGCGEPLLPGTVMDGDHPMCPTCRREIEEAASAEVAAPVASALCLVASGEGESGSSPATSHQPLATPPMQCDRCRDPLSEGDPGEVLAMAADGRAVLLCAECAGEAEAGR